MFGIVNMRALQQLGELTRQGHIVNAQGEEAYLPNIERMAIPITFIHGGENECVLPISTELTYNMLRERNGEGLYNRHVIPEYGHVDCMFGQNASEDVFPYILEHLEATQ